MVAKTKMHKVLAEVRKIIGKQFYVSIEHEITIYADKEELITQYRIWNSENNRWSRGTTLNDAFAKFKESRGLSSE